MKKLIKLIVLLLVLAGMVVGYVLYSGYMAKQEAENSDTPKDTTLQVLYLDSETITSIEYVYNEEKVSLKKVGDEWQWTEDAEFPLEQSYPESMLYAVSDIVADRLIAENLDNEADFGMDEPSFTINYSTSGGQSYVYTIGDYNSAAKAYYIKSSAQDKIYMTTDSAVDPFVYYMLEMIEVDTVPTVEAESIKSAEMLVSGKNKVLTTDKAGADFYADPYTYFYVGEDGVKIAADGQAAAELMSAVAGVKLGDVVAFKPDAETLEKYGLGENKTFVLKVVYNEKVENNSSDTSVNVETEKSYSVNIGKYTTEDGKVEYYVMLDGSKILYELTGGAALFAAMEADFASKLVCPILADDAVSFKIEIGTNVYFYNIADIENNEKLTGIFNSITSISKTGTASGEKGELVLKTTFDMSDKEMVLEIYKYDEENYVVSFDKWDDILVSSEKIDNIIKELQS